MRRHDSSPQQIAESFSRLEQAMGSRKSLEELKSSTHAREKRLLRDLTAYPARRGRGVWGRLWPEPLPARRSKRFEWGHWISGKFVSEDEQVHYARTRRECVEAGSYEYLKGRAGLIPLSDLDLPLLRGRAEFAAIWAVMTSGQRDEVGLPDVDRYIVSALTRDYSPEAARQHLGTLMSERASLETL